MSLRRPLVTTVMAASLTLTSCSAGSTATDVGRITASGVVVAATAAPSSLDFTNVGGAAIPQALMGNVYETLVTIGDDGEILPYLATSWTVSPDGTHYRFTLRDDVTFTNGDRFTAQTAAFSITNVQQSWTNGLKAQMAPVAEAHAVDDYTLDVTLHSPSNSWLWSMATLTGAMMTPTGLTNLASAPVGTGPYQVTRFIPGESIAFSPRPDYWGTPATTDAAIRYYADPTSSLNGLLTGDVDALYGMQAPELLGSLPAGYHVEVGTTNGEVLLSMNNQAAPFDDPRVRRAVAHAIDRTAVSQTVWEGLAVDTGGAPVPPTDPWYTGTDYAPFDPDAARRLLAEVGYTADHRPQVTITVPSLPYAQRISELIFAQLRDVGFDVSLESVEFPAVWLSQVMGAADYQMSVIAHVEPRDIPTLFANPAGYLRYDNPDVRRAVELADTTPGKYTEYMTDAVNAIMADMGALTLANMPNIVLTAPGVTGLDATVVTDSLRLADIAITEPVS